MSIRSNVRATVISAVSLGTLVLACSSSTTTPPPSSSNNPTPPGTTPVANAPYTTCPGSTLEPGSFTSNSGSYTEPATKSCTPAGTPTAGDADAHCVGVAPTAVSGAACGVAPVGGMVTRVGFGSGDSGAGADSGTGTSSDSGASADAGGGDDAGGGAQPTPGPCGENGPDYGATMFGTQGDDDDCKYHVSYTASPLCENNGTYFVVTATNIIDGSPVTKASTFAELCLSDTHPAPGIDSRPPTGSQQVVEGPPGTYTIGPVQFDAPGNWTVRFHFDEFCCDTGPVSPHGHAAFHVTVP